MITILAAVVGGLLTILGGLFQRAMREWGEVRVAMNGWQVVFPEAITADETRTRHVHVAVPGYTPYIREPDKYSSITASYSLSADLFNEKDVGTSLRDMMVVFQSADGKETEGPLWPTGREAPSNPSERHQRLYSAEKSSVPRRAEEFLPDPTVFLDLPPRSNVVLRMSGKVTGETGREVMKSERAYLRRFFPNGKPFRKEIAVLEEIKEDGDRWRTAQEQSQPRWRRLLSR